MVLYSMKGEDQLRIIKFNDADFLYKELSKNEVEQEGSEEILKEINVQIETVGKLPYILLEKLLEEKSLEVEIPNEGISGKFIKKSYSYSPPGEVNENTRVLYDITLLEHDGTDSIDQLTSVSVHTISTLMEVMALRDVLIEKGIITKEEVDDKYNEINARDGEKIVHEVLGIRTKD